MCSTINLNPLVILSVAKNRYYHPYTVRENGLSRSPEENPCAQAML